MPGIHHSRKYRLDQNFFSSWSPNMAYVLGFWFADGNMRIERSYRIVFSSRDYEHLYQIRKAMSSENIIRAFYSRKSKFPCFELCVHSKLMYHHLLLLGGKPGNSTTIQVPLIPSIFIPDFIRGYFDGDGSVYFIKYKHSKNGKIYTNIRSNFTSGSKQFLESMRDILSNELDLYYKKICQYGPFQFKLGYGQKDTQTLLKYMYYPDHQISLQRKAVFLKYF